MAYEALRPSLEPDLRTPSFYRMALHQATRHHPASNYVSAQPSMNVMTFIEALYKRAQIRGPAGPARRGDIFRDPALSPAHTGRAWSYQEMLRLSEDAGRFDRMEEGDRSLAFRGNDVWSLRVDSSWNGYVRAISLRA